MSQSSYFVALVYAFLKERNINTDDLPVPEAIEIFNNLQKNGKIRRVPKETLSNSGWARFYSKLGEKEIGLDGDIIYLPNGAFSFEVEGKYLYVVGTYECPNVIFAVPKEKIKEKMKKAKERGLKNWK